MEMKKAESRSILRTKKTLKAGLTDLLREKPVQQITVKELADYVNLNRGTFYLHYRDIYELLEDLENELFDSFQSLVSVHTPEEMQGHPFPLLKDIFRFIQQNASFTSTLLGQNIEYSFVNKLKELIREKCFADWEKSYQQLNPQLYDMLYAYILSGCIGLIERWLFGGMEKTPEEMAAFAERVVLRGVQDLVQE